VRFSSQKYFGIKAIVIALSIVTGSGIAYYFAHAGQQATSAESTISSLVQARDLTDVHNLFKKDWYWLSARDYTADHVNWMVTTGSPNEYEPEYFGKMKFKVLREGNKFIGFTAYYMKNFYHGTVLFLATEPEMRSKGYGYQLLMAAIQDLFDQGAQKVTLVARENNTRARKFYARSGLTEGAIHNGFVEFKIEKK